MTLLTMIVKMGEGLSKTCAIFSLTLLFSLPLGMIRLKTCGRMT